MYNKDKKINMNGYIAFYYPEHHRAYKNGCVYEHILVAEEKLGRELKDEECVHHIDFNRKNNSKDNLMVFKTTSDHTAFHGGSQAVEDCDGTYYCPDKNNDYDLCPVCKKAMKYYHAEMCRSCFNDRNIPSKEMLISDMKIMPNTKIAKKYGVSDRAVGKWIEKYGLQPRGRSGKHAYNYGELAH